MKKHIYNVIALSMRASIVNKMRWKKIVVQIKVENEYYRK
jgi:hypothetical protein